MDQAPTVLDVPSIAKELGERFADAGHELYLVGGSVRDLVLGRHSPTWTSARRRTRPRRPRCCAAGPIGRYLVGVTFGTVGALKDGERIEITTYRKEVYAEEHRKPAVTFGDDVLVDLSRRDFTINAMARAAARRGVRRSVRRRQGARGPCARHAAGPGDVVLRRPLADDPRRAVRRAARRDAGATAWSRRCARWGTGSRSCRRSGSATSSTSCSWRRTRRPGSRCWWRRAWPIGSCPRCRRCGWNRTPYTNTRTCCVTPTRWSNAASRTPCFGWPRCCTTSASPRRARSRARG